MRFRVEQKFGIPADHLTGPIDDGILEQFGFEPGISVSELRLAITSITGFNHSGKWDVAAHRYPKSLYPPNHSNNTYGRISFDGETEKSAVLGIAESWIKSSEATLWVPRPVIEVPQTHLLVAEGLLLVRANPAPKKSGV